MKFIILPIFISFLCISACSSVEQKENIDEKAPPVIAPQDSIMNM